MVEGLIAPGETAENAHERGAHRAARAAVGQLEQILLLRDDELAVDAHPAELVLDDRHSTPPGVPEHVIQQRRLPASQEAREHRDRDRVRTVAQARQRRAFCH
jgi:hypothetical protein